MTEQTTPTQAGSVTSGASGRGRTSAPARRAAQLLAAGLGAVVAFELALAAGAPWGDAAFGGSDPGRLSVELRVTSLVAAGFWLLASLTALARGGVAASPVPYAFSRRAIWGLTVLLGAGALMNAASSSPWERFGMAPFIVVMTALAWRLARSGRVLAPSPRPEGPAVHGPSAVPLRPTPLVAP